MPKQYFKKLPSKNVFYRNYKNFDVNVLRNTLLNELLFIRDEDISYNKIKDMLVSQLDTYAPIKKRLLRANDAPYMNNALRKSIMTSSRLKNRYTKDPIVENSRNYKKQRNYCVNLLKKSKRAYYRSIDIKIVRDNRNFWKNIKPFFSEKHKKLSKVILVGRRYNKYI